LKGLSLGNGVIPLEKQSSAVNLLEKTETIRHIVLIIPFIIALTIFKRILTIGYKNAKTCIKTIRDKNAGVNIVIKKLNKNISRLPFR
jgi:hypothetical protein